MKKFAWSGGAVLVATVLALGMMTQSALAAISIVTPASATVPLYTAAGNAAIVAGAGAIGGGPGFTTLPPLVLSAGGAGDISGSLIITAPAGWQFGGTAPTASSTGGATFNPSVLGAPGSGNTVTIPVNVPNTSSGTMTVSGLQIQPLTFASLAGTMTSNAFGGLSAGSSMGTVTPGDTGIVIFAGSTTPGPAGVPVGSVASDGSTSATLTFNVRTATNAQLFNTTVSVTTSRGTLSASSATTSSTACTTGTAGVSCTLTFRGNGSTGQANITATTAAPNSAAATFNMTVSSTSTSPTGVKFLTATNSGHLAASSTNNYTTPTLASRIRFQVTNSNGDGVNGELIQVTVDKGYVSAGDTASPSPGSCNGTNVSDSQTSSQVTIDGTDTAGIVQFTVCAKAGTTGTINVTAHDLTTSLADTKTTVIAAGAPAKADLTVTGNAVTVSVKDKDGNEAADGTTVTFGVPSFTGTVAPTCTTTSNGKATAAAAFSGAAGGQILVTVFINDSGTGAASTCTALGNIAAASATANVGAGGGTGTGTGAGFTGTAPARGSIGLLVTAGATNATSLVAALGTAGCTVESLAILEGGVWKIYINGAPAVVNANFPASVGATIAFFVRCAA